MCALKAGVGIASALLLSALTTPATARERLAVLIVADGDPGLGDDLTEVAIAALAEHRDRELVGTSELRARLTGILPEEGLGACLDRAECLARVGATAGAARAVIGRVQPSGGGHQISLSLTEMATAQTLAHVSNTVSGGMDPLVVAVRAGVNRLLATDAARASPAPPLPAIAVPTTEPAAGVSLASKPPEPRHGRGWLPYASGGAAVLAAVAFSAAAVTGTIAGEEPVGSTRAIAQADLEHRKDYATTANALLVAGAVLSTAAGAALVWWWRGGPPH
jgi:hypothetical protein